MCTRYITPEAAAVERMWHVGRGDGWRAGEMFPTYPAPFIRAARSGEQVRECVVGQWSLIPWFAKERRLKFPTANARSEELSGKASYKHPWARGQRCIIPAMGFYEPCWETGKHVPWLFKRSDGDPFGLAGLWNTWADPQTGEFVESFTMLTLNADAHPLMNRMHKPDPKRSADMQDKRSVVPIEPQHVDTWLHAPVAEAAKLIQLAPASIFDAAPGMHAGKA